MDAYFPWRNSRLVGAIGFIVVIIGVISEAVVSAKMNKSTESIELKREELN